MSDGGGESKRNHEQLHAKRKCDDFALAVAKIAVAQICESVGFQALQQSALETLSDIAIRYIHNIGKSARSYANSTGREDINVFDIIQGLEDLGSGRGFAGASDVGHCVAASGVVREIIQYVGDCPDIPFANSLPCFPVIKDMKPAPSFLQTGEEPPFDHIPTWLPAFPDRDTYVHLTTVNGGTNVSWSEKIEPAIHQRKRELPTVNLQQQFACNGSVGPSSVNVRDTIKPRQEVIKNPYLAAPLHFGEKEVSPIVFPTKFPIEIAGEIPVLQNHVGKHFSVMEAFTPAIEAMKTRLHNPDAGEENVLTQRPAVRFKITTGKKPCRTSLDISSRQRDLEKITSQSGTDKEKDEKKRKAETILKEAIENSRELAEL